MNDWISVEDQMPEDEGWYLCHFSDGSIETYPIDDHYGEAMEFVGVGTTEGMVTVTHWQPLPDPPQLTTDEVKKCREEGAKMGEMFRNATTAKE